MIVFKSEMKSLHRRLDAAQRNQGYTAAYRFTKISFPPRLTSLTTEKAVVNPTKVPKATKDNTEVSPA